MELATSFSVAGVIISAIAVVVSAVTAMKQVNLTASIHREQMTLSQRQLFLEIWPKMEALNIIDPASPVAVDVVRTANVLELVALCWEGGMVDSAVIRRSFGTRYIEYYENLQKVPKLTNPNLSGSDILRAVPAVGRLYDQLRKEQQEQNALRPVGD